MTNASSLSALAGRLLLAAFFVPAGFAKLGDLAGNAAFTASGGLPGWFVYPALALEIVGGLALLVGWQTRWAALGLAAFTVRGVALPLHPGPGAGARPGLRPDPAVPEEPGTRRWTAASPASAPAATRWTPTGRPAGWPPPEPPRYDGRPPARPATSLRTQPVSALFVSRHAFQGLGRQVGLDHVGAIVGAIAPALHGDLVDRQLHRLAAEPQEASEAHHHALEACRPRRRARRRRCPSFPRPSRPWSCRSDRSR